MIFSKFKFPNSKFIFAAVFLISIFYFSNSSVARAQSQLGASLYVMPLAENPKAGSNFTATIKVDSLSEPINAVKGALTFNKDKIEIINVSKIGSILNLWVEEPRFSNLDGTLRFSGGVPKPGFIGNGGVVLYVIFRAKVAGATSLIWQDGEVLAADGKGTNILTDLQNADFFIDTALPTSAQTQGIFSGGVTSWLIIFNIGAFIILFVIGLLFLFKLICNNSKRCLQFGRIKVID